MKLTRDDWMDAVLNSPKVDSKTKEMATRLRYYLPSRMDAATEISTEAVKRLASQWMPARQTQGH